MDRPERQTDPFVERHLLKLRTCVVQSLHRVSDVVAGAEVVAVCRQHVVDHRQVAVVVLHLTNDAHNVWNRLISSIDKNV